MEWNKGNQQTLRRSHQIKQVTWIYLLLALLKSSHCIFQRQARLIKSKHWGAFFFFYTKPDLCQGVPQWRAAAGVTVSFLDSHIDLRVTWGQESYLSIQGDRRTWSPRACWYRCPRVGKVKLHTRSHPGHTAFQNNQEGKCSGTWGRRDNTQSVGNKVWWGTDGGQ